MCLFVCVGVCLLPDACHGARKAAKRILPTKPSIWLGVKQRFEGWPSRDAQTHCTSTDANWGLMYRPVEASITGIPLTIYLGNTLLPAQTGTQWLFSISCSNTLTHAGTHRKKDCTNAVVRYLWFNVLRESAAHHKPAQTTQMALIFCHISAYQHWWGTTLCTTTLLFTEINLPLFCTPSHFTPRIERICSDWLPAHRANTDQAAQWICNTGWITHCYTHTHTHAILHTQMHRQQPTLQRDER